MYVRHQEEHHDAIVARAEKRRGKRQAAQPSKSGADATQGSANTTQSANKLVIKDKLKEVLCSRLMLSDTDADNLCGEICGQVKD